MEIFVKGVNDLGLLFHQLDSEARLLAVDHLQKLVQHLKLDGPPGGFVFSNSTFAENVVTQSISVQAGNDNGPNAANHILTAKSIEMASYPRGKGNIFLDELRRQLTKLIEEKRTLEVKIQDLEKRISHAEAEDPRTIVKELLNEIIMKVVPSSTVKRKRGRPKGSKSKGLKLQVPLETEVPNVNTDSEQPLAKRKRGRPRKHPAKEPEKTDALDSTSESARNITDQLWEPFKTNTFDDLLPQITDNGHTDVSRSNINLRSRRPSNYAVTAFDDDSDNENVSFEEQSSEEPELKKIKGQKLRVRSKTGGIPRPRGRPRKNPARDPETIKRHRKIVRHVCKICNAQFIHGRPFHRHLSSRHDAGGVSCLRCKREFENHAHYVHHKCEASRKFETRHCKRCDSIFKSFKKLQEHVQLVHGLKRVDPIYFCKFCDKGFIRKPSLIAHLKVHSNGQLVCEKCGEFCETEEDLSAHTETHKLPSSESLHCKRCGTVFFRKQQFEQHMAAHEKYDCSICNEAFSRKKILIKHVRDVHNIKLPAEEKRHVCTECNRRFHRPGQLEIHKRVHTGERPIECETCKMFFKSNKALWKHKQTHTHLLRQGQIPHERNHLCSICGKSYFRKQALQRHMRYHDDSKPFKCPHCKYRCRDNNNLKRHIQLHFSVRQFVCETCGAAFHAKKTLETHHLYKHSSERTHKCNLCPMTFKTPNSLRRHLVIHATVRPYKCPNCNVGFNRLYNLRRHMKGVHGTDAPLPPVNRVKVLDGPKPEEQPNNKKEEPDIINTVPPDVKLQPLEPVSSGMYEAIESSSVGRQHGVDPVAGSSAVTLTVPQVAVCMAHPLAHSQHLYITGSMPTFSALPEAQNLTNMNPVHIVSSTFINQQPRVYAHIPTTNTTSQASYIAIAPGDTNDQQLQPQVSESTTTADLPTENRSVVSEQRDTVERLQFSGPRDLYTSLPVSNILHLISNPTVNNSANNESNGN